MMMNWDAARFGQAQAQAQPVQAEVIRLQPLIRGRRSLRDHAPSRRIVVPIIALDVVVASAMTGLARESTACGSMRCEVATLGGRPAIVSALAAAAVITLITSVFVHPGPRTQDVWVGAWWAALVGSVVAIVGALVAALLYVVGAALAMAVLRWVIRRRI